MGLLKKFKATFKGEQKKRQNVPVVCVRYSTFSEFDNDPNSIQPSISNNGVVRQPKPRQATPALEEVFSDTNNNHSQVDTFEKVVFPKVTKRTAPLPVAPPMVTNTFSLPTEETIKLPETECSSSNIYETLPFQNEKVTEKLEETETKKVEEEKENFSINFAKAPLVLDSDSEEVENFQIHYPKSPLKAESDSEEEEEEEEEENVENPESFSNLDYSSQAASIFFGDEEEVQMSRPRNFIIDDDDDGNDSSASA